MLQVLMNILFILSPTFGFVPQITRKNILYKPFLSLLNILTALDKTFDYFYKKYDRTIFYQNITTILLHSYLIYHNKHKQYNRHYIEESHVRPIILKCSGFILFLVFLQLCSFGFLFTLIALFMDVGTTYAHFLVYKEDVDKPIELFIVWVIGDALRVIFNIFIYKTPILYSIAAIIQLVFDLLTMGSQGKLKMDVFYNY